MKLNELKQISDALDKREEELTSRETILADKEKTLTMAFKEFKLLVEKLEKYYDKRTS